MAEPGRDTVIHSSSHPLFSYEPGHLTACGNCHLHIFATQDPTTDSLIVSQSKS